jgi:hypothetical protein
MNTTEHDSHDPDHLGLTLRSIVLQLSEEEP